MRKFKLTAIIAVFMALTLLTGGCASPQAAAPVAPTPAAPSPTGDFTVTLSVSVETLLDNLHLLDDEMHELVPGDGILFLSTEVPVFEGESVFDVLQREMRQAGIHMTARNVPIYDSSYVEAIGNIFEFDAGGLSGWMYSVNRIFPGVGSSQHILNPGDVVEWLYTIDLGRDIGATDAWGG